MRVLIIRNNSNPQAVDASLLLTAYFANQSIDFDLIDVSELNGDEAREKLARLQGQDADGVDLVVVLGGDGTILHAARLLKGVLTPILGINFGRLGFLANACGESVISMVADALAGELVCERRTNLQIDVICEGDVDPFDDGEGLSGELAGQDEYSAQREDYADHASDAGAASSDSPVADAASSSEEDNPPVPAENIMPHPHVVDLEMPLLGIDLEGLNGRRSFFALNEIAITRGSLGRIIDFSLDISGSHIADMRGDGLVVATATGSTAYALSAGGPLVSPSFTGLITVPLSAHTLHARAILTGDNDVVRMELSSADAHREATLFIDGDLLVFDEPVKCIYVRRGPTPTLLLRTRENGFYSHAAHTFF